MNEGLYAIREIALTDQHLGRVSNLLNLVFGSKSEHSQDYLKWQYCENPCGHAVGFDAFLNHELAAHYVTIPVKAKVFSRECRGLLSLNTATHPDHRGKKLFTTLAEKTYELAKSSGYEFVVGVANQNSTHGFTKKLGFTLLTPLEAKIGFGKPRHILNDSNPDFKVIWDKESVQWRLKRPGSKYMTDSSENVYSDTRIAGIQAHLGPFSKGVKSSSLPRLSSLNPLRLWIGVGVGKQANRSYTPIPSFLKPSPLNLIYKSLTDDSRMIDAKNTEFFLSDFDAY